jgi:tetratricopeptide (TPR) repeat protein
MKSTPSSAPSTASAEAASRRDAADGVTALVRGLGRADGFALFIAVCNHPAEREELIGLLREAMRGVTLHRVRARPETTDLLAQVLEQVPQPAGPILITDLEIAAPPGEPSHPILQRLNLQRPDWQRRLSRPVILWTPEFLLALLGREAPDFLDWRSDTVHFPELARAEVPLLREMLGVSISAGMTPLIPTSRERVAELRERLAQTAQSRERAALAARADWLVELARSLVLLGESPTEPTGLLGQAAEILDAFGDVESRARSLVLRGASKAMLGDTPGAMADYTAAIELPGAPPDQVAQALNNRGVSKGMQGDTQGAMADYTAAIQLPGATPGLVVSALANRGVSKGRLGNTKGAIADYSAAIELPGAPPDPVAQALVNRGVSKGMQGDTQGAIADYSAAIELPGAPPDAVAWALVNRGVSKGRLGDTQGEIADCTTAIELPGAPPDQVAEALYNRGVCKGMLGDTQGAIADYTAAIELPGAPLDRVAMACANLGMCHHAQGRVAEASHWLERALAMAEHLPDKGEQVRPLLEEMQEGKGAGARDGGRGEDKRGPGEP